VVSVTDNVGGSEFLVECTSPSGENADWFLQLHATYYDTNALREGATDNFGLFQDSDLILWQDNNAMNWNA